MFEGDCYTVPGVLSSIGARLRTKAMTLHLGLVWNFSARWHLHHNKHPCVGGLTGSLGFGRLYLVYGKWRTLNWNK